MTPFKETGRDGHSRDDVNSRLNLFTHLQDKRKA